MICRHEHVKSVERWSSLSDDELAEIQCTFDSIYLSKVCHHKKVFIEIKLSLKNLDEKHSLSQHLLYSLHPFFFRQYFTAWNNTTNKVHHTNNTTNKVHPTNNTTNKVHPTITDTFKRVANSSNIKISQEFSRPSFMHIGSCVLKNIFVKVVVHLYYNLRFSDMGKVYRTMKTDSSCSLL